MIETCKKIFDLSSNRKGGSRYWEFQCQLMVDNIDLFEYKINNWRKFYFELKVFLKRWYYNCNDNHNDNNSKPISIGNKINRIWTI